MKILLPVLFFLLSVSSIAQNSETYSRVSIEANANQIPFLNDSGLEIDHFISTESNKIEVVLSSSEIAILNALEMKHEILIPDVQENFRAMNLAHQVDEKASCGLENYNPGSMGSYHTYDEVVQNIMLMQVLFTQYVNVLDIGSSFEGRTIYAVKFSDNPSVDESATEGGVYFDALTHAREPMSLESLLYFMWELLENIDNEPANKFLLENREIFFVPVVNPDGYVHNQTTDPNGGGFWRKNRNINTGTCVGVDLNRNYSENWGDNNGSSNDPCASTYRGTSAFSEPESQAVKNFVESVRPELAFSCHTYGDVFLQPNNYAVEYSSNKKYRAIASEFIPKFYNGYGAGLEMIGYLSSGSTRDYLDAEDIIAFTPEIGHAFWEDPADICDRVQEMSPVFKKMAWLSGAYPTFQNFEFTNTKTVWKGFNTQLAIGIKNAGSKFESKNVVVELSTDFPGVEWFNSSVAFEDLAPGEFTSNTADPFSFYLNESIGLAEKMVVKVAIKQEGYTIHEDEFYLYGGEQFDRFFENGENGIVEWNVTGAGSEWESTSIDYIKGSQCLSDSPESNLDYNTSSYLRMKDSVDITNAENLFLEFDAKWSYTPNSGGLSISVSDGSGTSWEQVFGNYATGGTLGLGYYNNQHWIKEQIDLKDHLDKDQLKLRFRSTNGNSRQPDGFYLDNIRLVEYLSPPDVSATNDLSSNQLTIFPNPSNDFITVEFKENGPTSNFEIINQQGQVVTMGILNGNIDIINLKAIVPGVYWLKINTSKNNFIEKLLVY